MRLQYQCCPGWPPLAWVARLRRNEAVATVYHGWRVELRDNWFCEAAWDGDFAAGDFDRTDIVSGTGARCRDGKLLFVSSGTTVDRLQWLARGDCVLVSNSLPGLLRVANESLDPTYPRYHRDMFSILWGLQDYVRTLPASAGPVDVAYFDNVAWTGDRCLRVAKPCAERRFGDFDGFAGFLRRSLQGVAHNMADAGRAWPYEFLGSLSTGYDSTTITALAAECGLREVICFAREGGRDRGSDLAHYFGVTPIEVDLDAWRSSTMSELPFVAGDCFGEEAHFHTAARQLAGKVLLSGYHGDKVWDLDNAFPNANIQRGDPSGGALTEFRLRAGFIHCAVPFMGVRAAESILAVNRSEAMRPWDVGGNYTRPVCRRIVEAAGVPREAFGMRKSFASRWFVTEPEPVSDASRAALVDWVAHRRGLWRQAGRRAPSTSYLRERMLAGLSVRAMEVLNNVPGSRRLGLHRQPLTGSLMNVDMSMPYHSPPVFGAARYAFPWAVDAGKLEYTDMP